MLFFFDNTVVMSFTINGVFLGEAFRFERTATSLSGALRPALSLEGGERVSINIGQRPFLFPPRNTTFYSLAMDVQRGLGDEVKEGAIAAAAAAVVTYSPVFSAWQTVSGGEGGGCETNNSEVNPSHSDIVEIPAGPIDLESEQFTSAESLQRLGLLRLKEELELRGMKSGGSLVERASRLFAARGVAQDKIDPKLKRKSVNKQ
jgi:hypothetical protein